MFTGSRSLRFVYGSYLVALACATFWPFRLVSTREAFDQKVERIKWVPLKDRE